MNPFRNIIRNRTARSSLLNFLIKPVSMILALISTPLLLSYLGDEKYGLWATILSVTSWINYCDVGIGHGLRNLLTKQIAKNEYEEAEKAISTAYVCMSGISCAILIVLIACSCFVNWGKIFNTNIDIQLTIVLSIFFICLNFVLALSNSVLYAVQKSEMVSARNILMQVIYIVGVFILKRIAPGDLVLVAILFGAGTTVTYLVNSISLVRKYKFFRPRIRTYNRSFVKSICGVGLKFFVIQIAVICMFTVDNLLITRLFGPAAVTPYSIVDKIYTTGYGFFTAITVPIWSASTEALAKHDYDWFDKAIKKLNVVTGVFAVGYILVGILFKPLALVWLQKELNYPSGLILVMVLYYIFQSFQGPYCQINNGIGALNGQVLLGIFQGTLNIPLSIFFAKNCHMGVVGIKFATMLLMGAGAVFQPIYYHLNMKKLQQNG